MTALSVADSDGALTQRNQLLTGAGRDHEVGPGTELHHSEHLLQLIPPGNGGSFGRILPPGDEFGPPGPIRGTDRLEVIHRVELLETLQRKGLHLTGVIVGRWFQADGGPDGEVVAERILTEDNPVPDPQRMRLHRLPVDEGPVRTAEVFDDVYVPSKANHAVLAADDGVAIESDLGAPSAPDHHIRHIEEVLSDLLPLAEVGELTKGHLLRV